jgi:hypothetical protein
MKGNLKRYALRDNLAFIDLPLPGDDLEASVTTEEPGSAGDYQRRKRGNRHCHLHLDDRFHETTQLRLCLPPTDCGCFERPAWFEFWKAVKGSSITTILVGTFLV